MAKVPFVSHVVPAEWGNQLPDGDYTIGRGANPNSAIESASEPGLSQNGDEEDEHDDEVEHAAVAKQTR